jgi:hypothetical protein
MKLILSISTIMLGVLLVACQEDKYPIQSLPQSTSTSQGNISDTLYLHQNPDWTGFNHPQAVMVGNEPLIYVADTYNDRIVMLDISGHVIGYSQTIRRPVAIAQDRRLQLLICAEFDTLLPGHQGTTTFGAVYRLNLPAVSHVIASAIPKRIFFEPSDSTRRYTAVGTLDNNTYYIARTGPKNDLTLIDRDDAILLFSKNDALITPVTTNFSPDGTGLLSIHMTTALATIAGSRNSDFIFAQVEEPGGVVPLLKVQWIQLVTQGQTTNYASKYPSIDPEIGITQINKFVRPTGVAVDPSGNLFVVDAAKDSLYRFNPKGIQQYSFGGTSDPNGLNLYEPYSVAYFDKTLFIANRQTGVISRFILSTDIR